MPESRDPTRDGRSPTVLVPAEPPLHFPFTAIEGQDELQQALLLTAIEPRIGGVVVEGPRGTAKTTAARGLAELLAPAPFVSLPLGCTIEHLVGSLDIGQALSHQQLAFAPGLLAKAHGGVLYVDEINLLPDALVDVLLDVAASGVNRVERDGISHQHAARWVLVGTMNAQEGRLRPQLLDRLGLGVVVGNVHDAAQRQRIVRARLAFDHDPQSFVQQHAQRQQALARRLARARAALAGPVEVLDAAWADVAQRGIAAAVDGLRADIVMLRAATAQAAWEAAAVDMADAADTAAKAQALQVTPAHVAQVAELVLRHRRAAGEAPAPAAARPASPPPAAPQAPTPAPPPSDAGQPPASQPQPTTPGGGPDAGEPGAVQRDAAPPAGGESGVEPSDAGQGPSSGQADWGGLAAEPVPSATAANPLLQRWLQTLSQAVAEDPPKKA
ncbi:hypothetical protein CCO03_05305 [Comamonas serinivorans]|uniref:AAA+ ATPase domain-containing protein n=1 Tax=Comamonas serinivorans TaxID=1082851 RepID=A0A1Y0EL47_9BURK|nr:AAA family ATPase [Comamonas serinivorans]ARU04171.1 hypothetical protein CCO03_05305 [Comamonas serinivorans]